MRSLLSPLLVLALLVLPVHATWSIVVVDRATGEVAVASATCIQRGNLIQGLPAIVVGKGAAAAQAAAGPVSLLTFIHDSIDAEQLTPAEIIAQLSILDPQHTTRQYGIVTMNAAPATFTGFRAGRARAGRVGTLGTLSWSIQGNVLTSNQVVIAAEAALLSTPGDLGQRVLAAMEAARALGGDGRCSCNLGDPTGCGAPPPSFTKSAHIGFLIVARVGDPVTPCSVRGCAEGPYYMKLNVAGAVNGGPTAPDPVLQLQALHAGWRQARVGSPDGILSTVDAVQALPADGRTTRTVVVRLVDLDGTPLATGGATVTVATEGGGASLASVGPVTDHGDGSYTFDLTAGTATGTDRFVITADDGRHTATLYPFLEVRSDPPAPLHAGFDAVPSTPPSPVVPLQLAVPGSPGAPYVLFVSATGTQPGLPLGHGLLPLNAPLYSLLGGVHESTLPGGRGRLDDDGRAAAALRLPANLLAVLAGGRVDAAAVVFGRDGLAATNAVGVDVLP